MIPTSLTVRPTTTSRASFGNYEYVITEAEEVVAHYWHDYRGDEHGVSFVDGKRDDNLAGHFIVGGGPEPLRLSDFAIEYITRNRPQKNEK
jgi:hypothetical protein